MGHMSLSRNLVFINPLFVFGSSSLKIKYCFDIKIDHVQLTRYVLLVQSFGLFYVKSKRNNIQNISLGLQKVKIIKSKKEKKTIGIGQGVVIESPPVVVHGLCGVRETNPSPRENVNDHLTGYWGRGTPLAQNISLFCAFLSGLVGRQGPFKETSSPSWSSMYQSLLLSF